MFLLDTALYAGSSLTNAWKLSGLFWKQTLSALADHFGVILLYAAPPATVRAWVLLRNKSVPAWWLPSLEALAAVWRTLMCVVAVWVVLTPEQMDSLRGTIVSDASVQAKLSRLGEILGRQTWLLWWEIAFFAAAFLLLSWLISLIARFWIQGRESVPAQRNAQRAAFAAVARNLLVYPLALIYIVVAIRHAFN
jgi:hypothetical protein